VERGAMKFQECWMDASRRGQIREACARLGTEWMKPIRDALPPGVTDDEIRLVMAEVKGEKKSR